MTDNNSKIVTAIGIVIIIIIISIIAYIVYNDSYQINDEVIISLSNLNYIQDYNTRTVMGNFNDFIFNDLSVNNDNNLWNIIAVDVNNNLYKIQTAIPINNGLYIAYDGKDISFTTDNENDNTTWIIKTRPAYLQYSIQSYVDNSYLIRNTTTNRMVSDPSVQYFFIVAINITIIDTIEENTLYTINFFRFDDNGPLILFVSDKQPNTQSLNVHTIGLDSDNIAIFTFEDVSTNEDSFYRIFITTVDDTYQFICKYISEANYVPIAIPYPNNIENESPESLLYWNVDSQDHGFKMEPRKYNPTIDDQTYILGIDSNTNELSVKSFNSFNVKTDLIVLSFQ